MPDYSKGKIYKLVSPSGLIYVGSTCQSLAVRKAGHKADYLRSLKNKFHHVSSFKLFDESIDDIDIVLLEECPCENKEQLHKKEREYIEKLDCVNMHIPTRTQKEYDSIHKDEIIARRKTYYNNNKEMFQKRNEEYREINKDKLKEHNIKYRLENAEKIKIMRHTNYLNNKEKILVNQKVKINCECGKTIAKNNLADHRKSIFHQNYIKSLNPTI